MVVPLNISKELLSHAVDQVRGGVTIADARKPNFPLIYVNAGFERLTGYTVAEALGKSCHFLQGEDTEQYEIGVLREALEQGRDCRVTLRNYRRDGSMFWNELSLTAVRNDAGVLTHFIGVQQDVTACIMVDQHLRESKLDVYNMNRQIYTLAHTDPIAGISNRHFFEEQLAQMLQTSQRTRSPLSVLLVNLDQFKCFNSRYGRAAGDACLRMVGGRIAKSFSRGSDCVARYGGDEFAVVSMGESVEAMQQHLSRLRDQIRALNIPHGDSPDGVVTICAGSVSLVPQRETTAQSLLHQASTALQAAKHSGYDCDHFA